jgi:hypothetical protein
MQPFTARRLATEEFSGIERGFAPLLLLGLQRGKTY